MDLNKTGLFISALRKQNDMTQNDLALKIGVTDKAVSRWETGKGFPDVSLLPSLAAVLGVSISEIVMGEKIIMEEKSAMEIMDKTVIDTLDYSQREINKRLRWRNIVIIAFSGVALMILIAAFFGMFVNVDMFNIMLVFFFIPIGLPVLISLFKSKPLLALRRFLWASPIVVFALAVLISWAYNPYFFKGLFDGYQDASRSRYYGIIFFLPCLTSVMVTAICYAVNGLRKYRDYEVSHTEKQR